MGMYGNSSQLSALIAALMQNQQQNGSQSSGGTFQAPQITPVQGHGGASATPAMGQGIPGQNSTTTLPQQGFGNLLNNPALLAALQKNAGQQAGATNGMGTAAAINGGMAGGNGAMNAAGQGLWQSGMTPLDASTFANGGMAAGGAGGATGFTGFGGLSAAPSAAGTAGSAYGAFGTGAVAGDTAAAMAGTDAATAAAPSTFASLLTALGMTL